jgi:hypothetical protein
MAYVTDEQLYLAKPRAMTSEHLRAWMAWHGVGQTDLAAACRVDRRTIYRWRTGLSHIPRTLWPQLAQQFGDPLPLFVETITHL